MKRRNNLPLALNNALSTLADKRLVGSDLDTLNTSSIIRDAGNCGGVGLVVLTPVILRKC